MRFDTNDIARWRLRTIGGLWFASVALGTRAAIATVVPLQNVEHEALAHAAMQTVERAKADRAQAEVDLSRAAGRPKVLLGVDVGIAPGNTLIKVADVSGSPYWVQGARAIGTDGAFTPQLRYGATLGVQSKIYDFGRSGDRIESARVGASAQKAEAEAARAELLARVRQAYLQWTLSEESARIAQLGQDNATARLKTVTALVEEGSRPQSDLLSARVDQAKAHLDLLQARGDVSSARIALESAAAMRLAADAEPDKSLLEASPPLGQSAPSPDLTAIERRRNAALAVARSHDHGFAPIISGLAEAGVRGQEQKVFPAYRIAVSLSIPLLDGGEEAAQRKAAKAQSEELTGHAAELARTLSNEEASARTDYRNANAQVEAAEQLQAVSAAAVRDAEDRYQLGGGGLDGIIDARQRWTAASLDVLHARGARAEAVLRLRGANRSELMPSP
jgi:outer membrane protein TolC